MKVMPQALLVKSQIKNLKSQIKSKIKKASKKLAEMNLVPAERKNQMGVRSNINIATEDKVFIKNKISGVPQHDVPA
jgi:hypothetical protein